MLTTGSAFYKSVLGSFCQGKLGASKEQAFIFSLMGFWVDWGTLFQDHLDSALASGFGWIHG